MKKFLLLFLIFLTFFAHAQETLKASISEEYVPEGFYGTWGVISKIEATTNPVLFNAESKDIWVLSGYSNVLFLENLETGAKSQIIVEKKAQNNFLKFDRERTVKKEGINKTIYKETVEFKLNGNNFSGYDNFIVENWQNNKLIKKSTAKYKVSGVKISGTLPK